MKAQAASPLDDRQLENHFEFGSNWETLLSKVSEQNVRAAVEDLSSFMEMKSLQGLSFMDVGCGSGLTSLAAYKLGASPIISVDIDPKNIANVQALKQKFSVPASANWTSFVASIVASADLKSLPTADVVVSWGVLHHTGAMWKAIENCMGLVNPEGYLYLMLYRDAVLASTWRRIKRAYTFGGPVTKGVLVNSFAGVLMLGALAKGKNPLRTIRDYNKKNRGMDWYVDVRDWVGGYPFEFASAQQTIEFVCKGDRFALKKIYPEPSEKLNLGWRGTGSYTYLFQRKL